MHLYGERHSLVLADDLDQNSVLHFPYADEDHLPDCR